ncbi:GNAT family N-acetyltransferase [Streptomyces sp. SID4917]|uniref:GNAT family N-acetyltransferase n=2 Tax=unclassified Streptomyces TaxID=2593676 RepID=UPI00081ED8C7|nr:GNAT family N-acetyltransferase [Streptomyces sp. SID4917]SCF81736.1 Acetyltransferase (GNAT) family protein [Streptomyces sp. MnatMP-M17]
MSAGPTYVPEAIRLCADELLDAADALADLMLDTVAGGASIGFLHPLDRATAARWWRAQATAVREGRLSVRIVRDGERIVGTVGVSFADKPNARHRAEIVKLMVHRDARGKGLGRTLLTAAEEAAAEAGVTLLLLDTETGSPAETLYRSAGWTVIGVVPGHAADPGGTLRPTTFFYKDLGNPKHLGNSQDLGPVPAAV